ncbi:MAG: DUF1638 domain-containing protein [Halobacteriota archaeon]
MVAHVGCVACSGLYDVLERCDNVDVRLIPQEFHESPVDPGDDDRIADRVQRAVDDLERSGCSSIAVCYSTAGDGLHDVSSERAPLRTWTVEDCTSALLAGRADADAPLKEPHTYYLTRGAIDRGLDPLKLYLGQAGEVDPLIERCRSALDRHPELVIDWFEGERYRALTEAGSTPDEEVRTRVFGELLAYYHRVLLLDVGTLYPFHRRYADRFGAFLEDIHRRAGQLTTVPVTTAEASDRLVRSMVAADPSEATGSPRIATVQPGEPLATVLAEHR